MNSGWLLPRNSGSNLCDMIAEGFYFSLTDIYFFFSFSVLVSAAVPLRVSSRTIGVADCCPVLTS